MKKEVREGAKRHGGWWKVGERRKRGTDGKDGNEERKAERIWKEEY